MLYHRRECRTLPFLRHHRAYLRGHHRVKLGTVDHRTSIRKAFHHRPLDLRRRLGSRHQALHPQDLRLSNSQLLDRLGMLEGEETVRL